MPPKLQISVGQCSDRGVKQDNQDFHGYVCPEEPQLGYKGIAIAIADGMSGSDAGKVASQASIVSFLDDYFCAPDSWSVKHSVQKILSATNSWLYSNGHSKYQSTKGMVCTLSILIAKSHTAHIFHIGDSRIYRLRNNNLELLTRDHRIWVGKGKSYLNRAMGIEPHLEVDYRSFNLEPGDVFLLSTDGLHDFIQDRELKQIIDDGRDNPQEASETMVAKALQNASDDNVTCQIVRIDSLPLAKSDEITRLGANRPFPPPLDPGMILDGYHIQEEIHASKRTQIYRAYDAKNERHVILKTPSVNYEDDPVFIEHFLHEEWAGKRLNHNNILKVLGNDRPKRCIYYVTEYIKGPTLRRWIDDNPKPEIKVVQGIIEQISKGLGAFHRLEMLHQDLKPENIIVDESSVVKIIDFGSVKIAGIAETKIADSDDPILGTLNYAAPEYLLGQRGDVRSDLFSLAVIAYEMLNGALPFGKDMPEKASRVKLGRLQYVVSMEHNPMVPGWMDGALKKALSINPNQRYNVLSEFVYDLKFPNSRFISGNKTTTPLIQRNPLFFWKSISAIQLLIILILAYLLSV